ncbi:MAG: hypothetical protein AAFV93_08565 [Chloroflexota bacterium]
MADKDWNNTPIEELDLRVKLFYLFKRENINTVGELLYTIENGVTKQRLIRAFVEKPFFDHLLDTLDKHNLLTPELKTKANERRDQYTSEMSLPPTQFNIKSVKQALTYIEGVGYRYIVDKS